jgi:hypothetical protein
MVEGKVIYQDDHFCVWAHVLLSVYKRENKNQLSLSTLGTQQINKNILINIM